MPQIAAAAAASAALSVGSGISITAAGTIAFTAPAWGSVAFAAAAGGASAFLQGAMAPKGPGDPGVQISSRQALAPAEIVYGETKKGGVFAYQGTDTKREYLNLIIVWAGHQIEEISEIWHVNTKIWDAADGTITGHDNTGEGDTRKADAEAAEPPKTFKRAPRDYKENVWVYNRLGGNNQSAITAAIDNIPGNQWTDDHRLRGCAYSYIRLKFSRRHFPQGLQNLTARIKGKNDIIDLRDDSVGYTDNPALCLADFLVSFTNMPSTSVSTVRTVALANICDEKVATAETVDLDPSEWPPRYQISAIMGQDQDRERLINLMLATMNARASWVGGTFYMSGGAWETPTISITDDDIRGDVDFVTRRPKIDRWNLVKGRFGGGITSSVRSAYTAREYPQRVSETMRLADGEELPLVWDMLFTPYGYIAQRLAKMKLLQSRQEISITIPVGIEKLEAVVTNNVTVTMERFGFVDKEFEIADFDIKASPEGPLLMLSLRETSEAVWLFSTDEEGDDIAGDPTELDDAFITEDPTIESVTEELSAYRQEVVTTIIVDVSGTSDLDRFDVQGRRRPALPPSTDLVGPWRPFVGTGSETRFEFPRVDDGDVYDVRARAISTLGIDSDWVVLEEAITVVGKLDPPSDVENFRVETNAGRALLAWTPTSDADLSHYVIRHQPVTSGGIWTSATEVATRVARPATSVALAAQVGTYFIKAVDKIGKVSDTAASFVLFDTGITNFTQILSLVDNTFADTFDGTNTTDPGGGLSLDKTSGDFNAEGFYVSDTEFDLGDVYVTQIRGEATFTRYEDSGLMDSWSFPIDDYQVLWDDIGLASSEEDISVETQMRYTSDDPSGSPTWSDWLPLSVSEVAARAFQFRVKLTSVSPSVSPLVSEISFSAHLQSRSINGSETQSSGTGYSDVTYTDEFYSEPVVAISPRTNATNVFAPGDWYALDDAQTDVTGFRVVFKNSSGSSAITRDYNWTAVGLGRKT